MTLSRESLSGSTWRAAIIVQVSRPPTRVAVQADCQQPNSCHESDKEHHLAYGRKRLALHPLGGLNPRRNERDQAENIKADRKPYRFHGVILIRRAQKPPQENQDEIKRQTEHQRLASFHRMQHA